MEIDYINGLQTTEIFGRSKYQKEIHERIKNIKLNAIEYTHIIKVRGIDTATTYLLYPHIVKKKVKRDNTKHITSQELAYLLKLIKLNNVIVTCYDLIPWIYDNNRSLKWRLNMAGLKKADRIITISEFSKNEIIKYLGYSEDKIHIIYPAVDHDHYHERRDREILKRFDIPEGDRVILYVGSEQSRKNFPSLIKAFSKLKKMLPDVKLLKIGNPQKRGARKELLKLTGTLNLQNDIVFVEYVPERDMPKFYNAADLFVFPSFYEGFGLPPLEAMACGTPVITSNTSSLPEVIGDAGIMVDPSDIDGLVDVMRKVLSNDGLREDMVKKGLKRAKMFSWEKAAKETLEVYEEVYQ
jgi:glycosyltransferase involved in cell wall biosynthesis